MVSEIVSHKPRSGALVCKRQDLRPASGKKKYPAMTSPGIRECQVKLSYARGGHIGLLSGCLAGGGNILRAGAFENGLGPLDFVSRVGVDGEQNATVFYAAFVAFGFVLGNAHADQGSGQAADCASDPDACQCGHDRSGGNEWPEAGDG